MQWGLEEGADVAALNPRIFAAGRQRARLARAMRRTFSPQMIRKAAKIVHVRFE